MRDVLKLKLVTPGARYDLVGDSGFVYGAAVRASMGTSVNPIFISPGQMITLDDAVNITRLASRFRVPEPIRQADQISRRLVAAQASDRDA